jgi:hypothetical protein
MKLSRWLLFGLSVGLSLWLPPSLSPDPKPPQSPAATGTIGGVVVDAADGGPLGGARVYLEPVRSPLRAVRTHNGSPSFSFARVVETDSTGEYLFQDIPPGSYRVHVERPGYKRGQVDVDLAASVARVTVGLVLQPLSLPSMHVPAEASQPYARTLSAVAERHGARLATVQAQRSTYLQTDVRTLTAGEVMEAVTMGEADLFRALQRMPGVGRRDDYTAVLWTRGAPWVQTRVYFDGMPLYNPTHAGSLFSSISPNGVGEVTYQPGVRSVAWGEGAAGILDLRSRAGSRHQEIAGSADLSLASAQLALDGSVLDGRARWMVAGRRTHVDALSYAWRVLRPDVAFQVPYDFADLTARVDFELGPLHVHASGLSERDRLRGDIPGLLVGNRGRWGNQVRQATARLPLGPVELSAFTGGTRFATVVNERWRAIHLDPAADEVMLPGLESGIDHDRTGVRIGSGRSTSNGFNWALGYEAIDERIRYDGPFSLLLEGIPGLVRDSVARVPFRLTGQRAYTATWGEARFRLGDHWVVQPGLRIEAGDSVRHHGDRLVAPRLSARWTPTADLALSAGWGRSYQYTQAIGAAAGPLGPQLHLGHLWVLAGRGYPAIASDIATAGAELWLDEAWILGVSTYHRHSTGVTEPDPTPGVIRADRSHVEADATAYGLELSARRLMGRWTASLGYALARAETTTELPATGGDVTELITMRFPGSADIRHSLDATAGYRINHGLRVGGAFSLASGVPFTRVILDPAGSLPRLGEPSAHRTPVYASLDLLVDYSGRINGWTFTGYLQLLNALGRRNRVTYSGSVETCPAGQSVASCAGPTEIRDRFRSGLPRLPLVGLRVAF